MSNHDNYFHLDAVRADLRARSVRSGFFTVAARGAQTFIQLGSIIILARLLTPEDFGVIAMVVPLSLLVGLTTASGLQTTVVHRERLDQREVSAFFWYAARVNLIACLAMAAAGLLLARVYGEPRVVGVAIAWAALLYLSTLCSVHEALLKRQLRFGTIMSVHIVALAIGTVVAISAALLGAGHWALLIQIMGMEGGRSLAMWVACRWRPSRFVRGDVNLEGVRALRSYWGHLSGFRALAWLGDQPDRILVSIIASASVVGLYDSARRWSWYTFAELYAGLTDVAVASMSRVREDTPRYRELVRRALTPLFAICLPVIAFLFVEAELGVRVLLGDQWTGALPFVRLMCVAAFVGGMSRVTLWLYLSLGETRRQLRWTLFVHTPVLLASILIGMQWGALGVATGVMTASVLLVFPSVLYCVHASPLTLRDFARAVWRPAMAAISAAAILAGLTGRLPDAGLPLLDLVVRLIAFGITYAATWLALPGGDNATRELLEMVGDLRGARAAAVTRPVAVTAAEASPFAEP
ncbi:MAG: lipopolysaccharide biosynthesis protein [Longimicrobiales bacterium]